jgi:hypothetical protein
MEAAPVAACQPHNWEADDMTPDQLTQALNSAFTQGAEQMLENTMAIMLPVLWLAVIALHLARPYMLHMIPRFTLRLAADIWWILYVALRDLVIVLTFIFSIMFLFPDVLVADRLPITGGLAALCLFAVLVIKLVSDVDEDRRMFILSGDLLGLGGLLYIVPSVLGLQATGVSDTGFWGSVATYVTSSTNPGLAVPLCWISVAGVTALGIYAVVYSLRQTTSPARPELLTKEAPR